MEKHKFYAKSGQALNYLLYRAPGDNGDAHPLIVYLHGMDGCGDDLDIVLNIESLPSYIQNGKITLGDGALVLAPQCPEGKSWAMLADEVNELIEKLIRNENVDANCISLTGASLGGMGTFDVAIAYPERFSCLVPVCAKVKAEKCDVLTDMPVWMFHGELDTGMGFSIVDANAVINKAGGQSRLTLLHGEGHEIRWIYYSEKFNVIEWMLSNKRT